MAEWASALFGRREELAALERALGEVERGGARAIWLRGEPGIGKSRLLGELATRARERGLLVLDGRAAELERERAFTISKLIDEHHPPGAYYFLQFMGVEPRSQGHGIGSALLARMLERCDREGARAYLDATSPHNKRLYERHGFRASGQYAPEGGPPLWPMWREPGAGT